MSTEDNMPHPRLEGDKEILLPGDISVSPDDFFDDEVESVPRIVEKQFGDQILAVATWMGQDDLARREVLENSFPEIAQRLRNAVTKYGTAVDQEMSMATRHVICAEALTEVLERHEPDESDPASIKDRVFAEYWQRAIEILRQFPERAEIERQRISKSYHVEPELIILACERQIKDWEEAPGILENDLDYCELVGALAAEGLLDAPLPTE